MVLHHVLDLQVFEDDDLILLRQLVRELVGEVVPLPPRLPPRLRERQPRLLPVSRTLLLAGEPSLERFDSFQRAVQEAWVAYQRPVAEGDDVRDSRVHADLAVP